jgi:hypothetical protein
MSQEQKSVNAGSKSDLVNDLMQINNLQYSIGRSLSVCTSSNYVYEPLNVSGVASGPNKTIQRTLNTGSSFVHGGKSYLVMKVKFNALDAGDSNVAYVPRADANTPATEYAHFGKGGSVLNCIEEVIVRTKDGVEVSVDRYADNLNNILALYENSRDYLQMSGSNMGFTAGLAPHGSATDQAPVDCLSRELLGSYLRVGETFCIPMSAICRLFAYDRLLPSQLMSGLSISFKFKDTNDAFTYVGAGGAVKFSYEISDAYMRIATCDLSDSMQSKIATMSEGKGGLKILIDDFHHERQTGVETRANINVRANIAQATQMIILGTDNDKTGKIAEDPFETLAGVKPKDYYFRHGSTQYPKTKVENPIEHYQQTVNAFSKQFGKNNSGAVSYEGWKRKGKVLAFDFSRGDLELNGVALSNSKTLTFSADYNDGTTKDIDVWVRHSKLLSVFLNNSVVES